MEKKAGIGFELKFLFVQFVTEKGKCYLIYKWDHLLIYFLCFIVFSLFYLIVFCMHAVVIFFFFFSLFAIQLLI